MRAFLAIACIVLALLCGAVTGYAQSGTDYPNANGDTVGWVVIPDDSLGNEWKGVNEATANDADYWFWTLVSSIELVDTLIPTADGNEAGGWVNVPGDSVDWRCVNEASRNESDYMQQELLSSNSQGFRTPFDTSLASQIDSVVIVLDWHINDNTTGKRLEVTYRPSGGGSVPLDTFTSIASIAVDRSRAITGLVKNDLAGSGFEPEFTNIDNPDFLDGFRVYWVRVLVYYRPYSGADLIFAALDSSAGAAPDSVVPFMRTSISGEAMSAELEVFYDNDGSDTILDTILAVAGVDTLYTNGTGDTANWRGWRGSETDSNWAQVHDSTSGVGEYIFNDAGANTELIHFDDLPTNFPDPDSIVIESNLSGLNFGWQFIYKHPDSASTILIDSVLTVGTFQTYRFPPLTGFTIADLNSMQFGFINDSTPAATTMRCSFIYVLVYLAEGGWATYQVRSIGSMTLTEYGNLELGVRRITGPPQGDSIRVSWVYGEFYESAAGVNPRRRKLIQIGSRR